MDAVITYVNGDDPLWIKDFETYAGVPLQTKRYRDWGTLRFLFRSIESNMPFVDRVFLVVARESQIPEWVNPETVKVVLHKDFIPAEHLPTFNASMIEMFLHRIPGLGERFLYLNDDIFPVRPVYEDIFFRKGKPAKKMHVHFFALNPFRQLCRHSDRLSRKAAGKIPVPYYLRPQHSITPMLKSACEEAFSRCEADIMATLTPVRADGNYNQYFFSDYMFHKRLAISKRISHKHFSLALTTPEKIYAFISNPSKNFVCINDVEMTQERYESFRDAILKAFAMILPDQSRFEIEGK